jgi:hypothetical protein
LYGKVLSGFKRVRHSGGHLKLAAAFTAADRGHGGG